MSADQAFAERIQRIQTGTQWAPEGVIMRRHGPAASARVKGGLIGVFRRLVVLALTLGVAAAVMSSRPDLLSMARAGEFQEIAAALQSFMGG